MDFAAICPPSLKQVQHYLKLAQEHDERDIIVAYWSRLYALQVGIKASTHTPEETKLLGSLMDWLEEIKKVHSDNEAITNEIAAQAHMENYALKLFLFADKQDREANFGKNVVKAFYSSGILYDVLQTFGELTEESIHNRKYAKWKAAYIHNCLKNGETPVPGPLNDENEDLPLDNNPSAIIPNVPQDIPANEPNNGNQQPPNFGDEDILSNSEKFPSPPVDEEKPGGFVPYEHQPNPIYVPPTPVAGVQITPDQMIKAQKYCKYAGSALNYDDVKTAVENLQKALTLLTTGQDV